MSKLQFASEISSIIQNIAVVFSLIFGGIWAYQTYIFQNPAFYETGSMVIGQEAKFIDGEIDSKLLSASKRLYEIEITINNFSKKFDQLLNYDRLNIVYQKLGSIDKKNIEFKSLLQATEGIWIPRQQSKKLKLLVEFPEPGTYLIEANLCEKFLIDCIFQEYIHVKSE